MFRSRGADRGCLAGIDIGPRRGERGRPILRRNGDKIACPLLLFSIGRSPRRRVGAQRLAELCVVEARGIFRPLQICTEQRAEPAGIAGLEQGLLEITACRIAQVRRFQLDIGDTIGVSPDRFVLLALAGNLPCLGKRFLVVPQRHKGRHQLQMAGRGFRILRDGDARARNGEGKITGHIACRICPQRIGIGHFCRRRRQLRQTCRGCQGIDVAPLAAEI